jgi:hypothetical protein
LGLNNTFPLTPNVTQSLFVKSESLTNSLFARLSSCRGGRIRTYDLHIPNVARYQATLHPDWYLFCKLAEREGFEPSVPFPVRMFSKHVLSATQAPLLLLTKECKCKDVYVKGKCFLHIFIFIYHFLIPVRFV